MSTLRSVYLVCASVAVAACGMTDASGTSDESGSVVADGAASAGQALTLGVGPRSISYDYAHLDALPGGVAGTEHNVFVGIPLDGKVLALSRDTGRVVGELPPPPGGFVLPFIMHKEIAPGRLAVLDAGGFPSPAPFVPANPSIYEYTYTSTSSGHFSAELARTVSFASVLVGFAEDIVNLDDGRYLLSDTILGRIWVVERDGTIRPGIGPKSNDPADALAKLSFCPTMPLVHVGGIPFLFSGATEPGVESLAVRDGIVYCNSPCSGALYSFRLSILSDRRQPWERAADIRLVSPKPPGIVVEQLLGLTFNPYLPRDRWLYAADSLQLRIIRIDVDTGQRQIVADDPKLFNFPSSTSFLPPVQGISPLLVVSNQQHRLTILNDAIDTDLVQPPFIVTKLYVAAP